MIEVIFIWGIIIPILAVLCIREYVRFERRIKRCDEALTKLEATMLMAAHQRQDAILAHMRDLDHE